jgi:O-antigen/teichoic acid export membrane protein
MGIAFVPVYIRYLGMEAYGLIGIFALLQSWLALLDLGLTPTVGREMARLSAGAHTPQSIRDLLRSIEWIYVAIAVLVAVTLFFSAHWLASEWVRADNLPISTVADALAITGYVIAVRWIAGLYRSALIGLQRQVWLNSCTAIFSTARGVGVVGVMAYISPTVVAFFVYQGLLVTVEALVLATTVARSLPNAPSRSSFRWQALREIWRFAVGMASITLLSILLVQVDKLVLSKLLPLAEFGYYALASTVAGALGLVVGPVNNAVYPRLTEIVAGNQLNLLAAAYHRFSQMLTLMLVPTAIVLSLFSQYVLLLWTRDPVLTKTAFPLVSALSIGTMLNGLMHTPYSLQLAYGWTRFMVMVNAVSVLIVVPGIYFGVQAYGAIAAAYIWILLNAGYVFIAVPLMHRKLLPTEMWRWYGQDILWPTLATLTATGLLFLFVPAPALSRPWTTVAILAAAVIVSVVSATAATPLSRGIVSDFLRGLFSPKLP